MDVSWGTTLKGLTMLGDRFGNIGIIEVMRERNRKGSGEEKRTPEGFRARDTGRVPGRTEGVRCGTEGVLESQ